MRATTTTDLAKFGWREKMMAARLLSTAIERGLPDDFEDDEVVVMFNMDSGNVFLTNAEYQVAMMNGDKLESWYYCSECGAEGFAEDINWNAEEGMCGECAPKDEETEDEARGGQ